MMAASNRRSLCGTVQCKCSYLTSNQWYQSADVENTTWRLSALFDEQVFCFSMMMMIKYKIKSEAHSRIVLTAYISGHVHNSWWVLGKCMHMMIFRKESQFLWFIVKTDRSYLLICKMQNVKLTSVMKTGSVDKQYIFQSGETSE